MPVDRLTCETRRREGACQVAEQPEPEPEVEEMRADAMALLAISARSLWDRFEAHGELGADDCIAATRLAETFYAITTT